MMRFSVVLGLLALLATVSPSNAMAVSKNADDEALARIGVSIPAEEADAQPTVLAELGSTRSYIKPTPTWLPYKPAGYSTAIIAKFPLAHELKGAAADDWGRIQKLLKNEPSVAFESDLDLKLDQLEKKFAKVKLARVPNPIAPHGSTLFKEHVDDFMTLSRLREKNKHARIAFQKKRKAELARLARKKAKLLRIRAHHKAKKAAADRAFAKKARRKARLAKKLRAKAKAAKSKRLGKKKGKLSAAAELESIKKLTSKSLADMQSKINKMSSLFSNIVDRLQKQKPSLKSKKGAKKTLKKHGKKLRKHLKNRKASRLSRKLAGLKRKEARVGAKKVKLTGAQMLENMLKRRRLRRQRQRRRRAMNRARFAEVDAEAEAERDSELAKMPVDAQVFAETGSEASTDAELDADAAALEKVIDDFL